MEYKSFNRTFMELKHIRPQSSTGKHAGFNRTFMELKLGKSDGHDTPHFVLIGPSWN